MNGLDLFSGIGGLSLALREYVRPLAYCEIEPYCQAVLLSRMVEGSISNGPIWDDIRTLEGESFDGFVDIIYGGFPCQGISVAGKGKGLEDERSGLFFEIVRLCREIKPRFIFLENVPAITCRGGTDVVRQIATMGYDCRWCVISAASVGALHKRDRWFLLAHSLDNGTSASEDRRSLRECTTQRQEQKEQAQSIGEAERTSCLSSDVADTQSEPQTRLPIREKKRQSPVRDNSNNEVNICNAYSKPSIQTDKQTMQKCEGRETWGNNSAECWPFESRDHWQKTVSEMGKLSNGVSNHMAGLKALGNAVVPQQARKAFEILMGI